MAMLLPPLGWGGFLLANHIDGAGAGLVAYAAFFLGVGYLTGARFGVDLCHDGVVLRGVRRRVVPWNAVQAIEAKKYFGTRVVVLVVDGRLRRLRAPFTGPLQRDRQFDDKLAALRSWWMNHRDPGAVLLPAGATVIDPRETASHIIQLAVSALVALYVILLILAATVGHRSPMALVPAALVSITLLCLLDPLRPRLGRLLRRKPRRA